MQGAERYHASSNQAAEERESLRRSFDEPVSYLSSFGLSPTEIEALVLSKMDPRSISEWLRPDLDRRNNPFQIGTGFERLGNIIAQGDEGRFLEETLWPAACGMLRLLRRESRSSRHDPVKQLLGEQAMTVHAVEAIRTAFLAEQAKLRGKALSTAANLGRSDMMQDIQTPPTSIAQVSFAPKNGGVYTDYRFESPTYARPPYHKAINFSHISNTYEAETAAEIMPCIVDAVHPILHQLRSFWR